MSEILCYVLSFCPSGAAIEEVNKHWDWLVRNLFHSLSVFENKEDVASFVKGKVKVWNLPTLLEDDFRF